MIHSWSSKKILYKKISMFKSMDRKLSKDLADFDGFSSKEKINIKLPSSGQPILLKRCASQPKQGLRNEETQSIRTAPGTGSVSRINLSAVQSRHKSKRLSGSAKSPQLRRNMSFNLQRHRTPLKDNRRPPSRDSSSDSPGKLVTTSTSRMHFSIAGKLFLKANYEAVNTINYIVNNDYGK